MIDFLCMDRCFCVEFSVQNHDDKFFPSVGLLAIFQIL